uniref:Rho GTPase activating protein 27, like n=1 Tax=Paramormyrops kingsleyae TaxID=1676925 RepID=A0A3B3TFL7_9TELE
NDSTSVYPSVNEPKNNLPQASVNSSNNNHETAQVTAAGACSSPKEQLPVQEAPSTPSATTGTTADSKVETDGTGGRHYSYNPPTGSTVWPAKSAEPQGLPRSHILEKAGIVNKTKISDNGKRLRKSWSPSWTVLHGGILTFHKDPKSTPAGNKSTQIIPEYTVELRGATINWATKDKSSKKNVLELKTRHGSEYLMQYDTISIITDWVLRFWLSHVTSALAQFLQLCDTLCTTLCTTLCADGRHSTPVSSTESEQGRVRNKLRRFLQRRPTLQSVKERGYIQGKNVFGCPLENLCTRERSTVPSFVDKCIKSVEKRGLDIDGIYRVSGNLAVIQKLRYKVDHEENLDLDDGQWEEIHVITGALKLFFRELPEPLFPFSHFNKFIALQFTSLVWLLVRSLPQPNYDTMKVLFGHLHKVIQFGEKNRMSAQSVAIVFGPTLLRPEVESANITMYMIFQTQIVEFMLKETDKIFQA